MDCLNGLTEDCNNCYNCYGLECEECIFYNNGFGCDVYMRFGKCFFSHKND